VDYQEFKKNLAGVGFVRHYPVFAHHAEPNGKLPDDKRAHAAWYYCMCLVGLLRELDEEHAQYEGERDHTNMANNIAMSVAALYDLESPSELFKFLPYCKAQAEAIDIGWDSRMETLHILEGFRRIDN